MALFVFLHFYGFIYQRNLCRQIGDRKHEHGEKMGEAVQLLVPTSFT